MKCPSCRKLSDIAYVQYTQLGPDKRLIPINVAMLSCGCKVPLNELDYAGCNWEARVRRRLDDNLRSVFG